MMVDTIQIQQIILNLGRNALEAMGEGDANPHRLTIRTSLRKDDAFGAFFHFTLSTTGRDGHVDA